jgi:cytochrome c553
MRGFHLVLFGIVGVLLPSCPAQAADATRGRAVVLGGATGYAARTACHLCHGVDGAGDSAGAFPRLAGQASWYLYKQLKDYASGARRNPVMEPIARALDDAAMQDVSAYYAASSAPAHDFSSRDPLLLQRGGAIAAIGIAERGVAACVNCHGPEGRGLPPSFPALAGLSPPYAALQLRLWKDGGRANSPLGVMAEIARALSDDDIDAVTAYFGSVRVPAGTSTRR